MNVREEIEGLTAFEGRGPGSDAERRAAGHLSDRLEEMGREVEVESIQVWPRWPLTYAIHVALAIAGSVISVTVPVVGALLVLIAVILTFLDAIGMAITTRRLLGRRSSQNVISREDGDKPGDLYLVAHYDAGRGGLVFNGTLQERRAALSVRKAFVCRQCGATFTHERGRRRWRGYCADCAAERERRRVGPDTAGGRGSTAYRAMVARLRRLDEAAWAVLPDEDRTLVQRAYGLQHEAPVPQRQLVAETGRSQYQITQALARSVALLLGDVPSRKQGPATCPGCGQTFLPIKGARCCSRACVERLRRRNGRPERAALLGMEAHAFAMLPALDRSAVRLYYGLDGGEPMTDREVAVVLGISRTRGQALVKGAVAQLLGRPRSGGSPWQRPVPKTVTCAGCGRPFSTTSRRERYCSHQCMVRRRRRRLRPAWDRLQRLEAAAFAVLTPLEGAALRMYYGLEGNEPLGQKQVERALHLGHGTVRLVLHAALAKLLPSASRPPEVAAAQPPSAEQHTAP
jgi:hypothetical protein